jgi:membrane associated rhomboid family serine protease
MRLRHHDPRRFARVALQLFAVLLICGIAAPSAAAALGPMTPHLGVSAAALSLMLAAAAGKPRN